MVIIPVIMVLIMVIIMVIIIIIIVIIMVIIMLNNFCFHVNAQKCQVVGLSSCQVRFLGTWDMLNFFFYVHCPCSNLTVYRRKWQWFLVPCSRGLSISVGCQRRLLAPPASTAIALLSKINLVQSKLTA